MREFHAPDPAKGGSSRSISLQLEKAACRLAPMAGRNSPSQPDGFYGGVLLSKRGMRIRGRMPIERQPGVSASTAVSFPNGSAPGLASGLAVQCLRAQSFFLSDCARNFCIFTASPSKATKAPRHVYRNRCRKWPKLRRSGRSIDLDLTPPMLLLRSLDFLAGGFYKHATMPLLTEFSHLTAALRTVAMAP